MGRKIKRIKKKFGKLFVEKNVRERWRDRKRSKKEAIKKLQSELTQEWNRFLENKPGKSQISHFIRNTQLPFLQRKALKMFLKIEDIEFEDCYLLTEWVMKIKGIVLKRAFWKKCFALALPEDWVNTIKTQSNEDIREIFFKELEKRSKKNQVPKKQARQILIQLFEEIPEGKIRERLWRLLKILNPTEEDYLKIAGLECMKSLIGISFEIRTLLEKFKQEKYRKDQKNTQFQQIIDGINQRARELEEEQIKKGLF